MHENVPQTHSVSSAPDRQTEKDRDRDRKKRESDGESVRERKRQRDREREREGGRVHFTLEKLFPALISKAVSTQEKAPVPNPFRTCSLYSLQTTSARLHRV